MSPRELLLAATEIADALPEGEEATRIWAEVDRQTEERRRERRESGRRREKDGVGRAH